MTSFQQSFTNAAWPYGPYILLASEPGTFRLFNATAPNGLQEVLLYVSPVLAGWTQHDRQQDDTIAGG